MEIFGQMLSQLLIMLALAICISFRPFLTALIVCLVARLSENFYFHPDFEWLVADLTLAVLAGLAVTELLIIHSKTKYPLRVIISCAVAMILSGGVMNSISDPVRAMLTGGIPAITLIAIIGLLRYPDLAIPWSVDIFVALSGFLAIYSPLTQNIINILVFCLLVIGIPLGLIVWIISLLKGFRPKNFRKEVLKMNNPQNFNFWAEKIPKNFKELWNVASQKGIFGAITLAVCLAVLAILYLIGYALVALFRLIFKKTKGKITFGKRNISSATVTEEAEPLLI